MKNTAPLSTERTREITAEVGSERRGLLVRRRHGQGHALVAVDGVDVLGVAGEGKAEAVGGAGAVGRDLRGGA